MLDPKITRTEVNPTHRQAWTYKCLLYFILLDLVLNCFYATQPRCPLPIQNTLLACLLIFFHYLLICWARRYGLHRHRHLVYPMLVSSVVLLLGLIRHFFF